MNAGAELRGTVERIGRRFRRLRLWGGLAACWAVLAAVGLIAGARLAADAPVRTGQLLAAAVAASAATAGLVWWLVARRTARDPRWVARRIESRHPDLSALLLTAVEQHPPADGRLGFLQAAVVESAVAHSRSHDWDDTVPRRRLFATGAANGLALAGLVAVLGWLAFRTAAAAGPDGGRLAVAANPTATAVVVEPGHTDIERGATLLVTARFPGSVPAEASLAVEGASPRPMARNLDDPTFAGFVPTVTADLAYRVEFPGGHSETFRVKVFEHPELVKANARLVFPSFTGLEPKTVDDVRHVTVVEGTEVTLDCQLNKPVARAVLVDEQKRELPLTVRDAEKHVYTVTLTPTESRRYRLQLTDPDGRANKLPTDLSVNVTRNLLPVVVVPRPGRDTRVSPLEELPLRADLKDDFGLIRYGVSVTPAGQPTREVVLGENAPKGAPKRVQPGHLVDFEALKAQPDQVVSYYFWAEDLGPDGRPRRTSGDLYFAEVRHFEEIFRQGEQQTREQQERERQEREEGQGENAQAADQLAEMQKQIVNATWRLIRRETAATPTPPFAADAKLLVESQQAVVDKAGALAGRLQGASAAHLADAVKLMEQAKSQLGGAAERSAPGDLPAALSAEQAAYQALLKLRAREFEVTRSASRQKSKSSSSASSSRSPSQQQLRQLDLADEQQRYETQSAAREQREKQAQKERQENQELADRLKELARRQTDLTDRAKELQSALTQAREEKKRAEAQQQLKRLRDQQQQLLRDTDELQERLEQDQNRDRLADARQQVEEGREQVRRASEALEKGQLGQAVNDGTRAQRQLEAVRDQLRRATANQFGEEVRELRQQARQLDETQQNLTKQLDEQRQNPRPGLKGGADREQIQKGLEQQKKQFDRLTERVQKTVQEAEKAEPLLAQELYNTARGAAEQKVGDSLDLARRLAAGGLPEAAEASRKAAQGTEQLRKGIDKAAESVLGGQTDALKRAQRELDELAEQVNREIAQATGQPQPGRPGREGQPQAGAGQPKSDQPGRPQPGGPPNQPGQSEQGRQPGQQPGQAPPQPGQQPGQPGQQAGQPGQQPGQAGSSQRRSLTDPPDSPGARPKAGGREGGAEGGGGGARGGPIREDGFREWYDRMRATEDLIDDPQLKAEAARLRERVRSARDEFKRHAKEPDWKQLRESVATPLTELRDRVAEEIRRRESPHALVPIDRDPVPPDYAERVRRYYERLGSGR